MERVAGTAQGVHCSIEYGERPGILLFGDTDAAFQRGRRTVALAGCRLAGESPVEHAVARLTSNLGAESILVEVESDSPHLAPLLRHLNALAKVKRMRSVVAAPEELIDAVAASTPHPGVAHLCRATEAERIACLTQAAARGPATLQDIGRDGTAVLHQLSEEVGRIASILAALSEEETIAAAGPKALPREDDAGEAVDPGLVRSVIRARRLRDQYFRGELFADPAWDMLLDLLAARLEGNRVAVSSLCIAAAVPPTTALRWIKMLTDQGLLVRTADPQDGRRVFIELSDGTARALAAYFRAVQRIAPVVI